MQRVAGRLVFAGLVAASLLAGNAAAIAAFAFMLAGSAIAWRTGLAPLHRNPRHDTLAWH